MVDNLDLSTLISQIPEAQKIHHILIAHPEAQQALAQELVLRRQKLEKTQIAKTNATDETQIDPDEPHQSPQEQFLGERRKHRQEAELESDQGHLIDTQV